MKTNSPATSTLALCVLGALSSTAADKATAFQLGQLQETSRIGAPLDAYINVLMSPAEAQLATEISLIPDFEYRNDPTMNAALRNIRAEMVQSEYGHHYIKLSSDSDINVPLLAFRIKAINGDNLLIRRFALNPKPSLPAIVQSPRTRGRSRDSYLASEQRQNISSSVPQAHRTQTNAAITSNNEYGPVKAGDTLWKIAAQFAGDQAGSMLNELFQLNPHAFIDGDINKLRQGVQLKLPQSVAASIATAEAPETEIAKTESNVEGLLLGFDNTAASENADTTVLREAEFVENTTTATNEATTPNGAENVTIVTPSNVSVSTTTTAPDWQAENPALAERLEALGEKYAALRTRYAAQQVAQSAIASLTKEAANYPIGDTKLAQDSDQVQETAQLSSMDASDSTIKAIGGNDSASAEPEAFNVAEQPLASTLATPSATDTRFPLPIWLVGIIGLAVLAGAAGIYMLRMRRAAEIRLQEQIARKAKDNSLKEELAKKAQHRVKVEDEVERMLHERIDDESVDEIEKTMQLKVEEVLPVEADEIELDIDDDDSPEHQINDSIAHGRYTEAEDLLREVISASPRNHSAKLRLAEVFYITERIDDFVEISQDIHANHRAEISDEDWRRVMRMGKMIAPEQPPFSGPQSIIEEASAG